MKNIETIVLKDGSPLMEEMNEWTLGEMKDVGVFIAFTSGLDLDEYNRRSVELSRLVFDAASGLTGGLDGEVGLQATALVAHVACNLAYSVIGSMKSAIEIAGMLDGLDGE